MPVLTPFELWEQSGRGAIPEIFRLQDRAGRDYVLPMTHEETMTFHAKEIASYRQLPQLLYHFAIKERDEPRSRGGLLRLREFIMKDAYSFDRDEAELDVAFRKNEEAYHRMFQRAGLEYSAVQAESGMMGGKESIDFLAPSGSGENTLVTCENGDFAADLEVAHGVPRAPELPAALTAPKEVATPGVTTIEALAEMLGVDARRDVEGDAGHEKRRHTRARSRSRRRPAVRAEDARCARERLPPGDGRRDPRRVRGGWRLPRAGRRRRRGRRRRGAARWAVRRRRESRRLAPARGRGRAGLRAALRGHPRSASRAMRAPSAAARSASRRRSRSATSSSSASRYSEPIGRDVPRRGRNGEAAHRRKLRRRDPRV